MADGRYGPECRARGAIDDKGQVLFQIEAVRGLLATDGRLPVNVKFLVEGEEEVGSPHFEALLVRERERLACDLTVVSDTDMWAPDVPSVCVGMRGLVAFDVQVRTAAMDLHSGLFGGAVPNSAHLVARLVASLHDDDGRVTVPGFYDDVRPLTPAEEASLATIPLDEDAWRRMAGVAPAGGRGRPVAPGAHLDPSHVRGGRHRHRLRGRRDQDHRPCSGPLQGDVPARPRPATRRR